MAVLRRTDGTVTYTDLRTLRASSSTWQQVMVKVTTPADISTIKVVHLIRSNGWVQTDNFFLGTATTPPPPPPPATGNFRITATGGLIDPDGQPFLPRGLDVTGANSYVWDDSLNAHGKSDYFKNTWKLNAIRLLYCEKCVNHSPGSFHYGNLDDLIAEYTAKKMVVVVHNQEGWPCDKPDAALQAWTKTFFTDLATKYKSNPYVWYETYNEPLYDNQVTEWAALQEPVLQAIRATGNKNMVVANDTTCGQGRNASSINGPFNPADSGALVKGQEFMQKYSPIAFDVHIYDRWAFATTDADMKAYFDTAHSKGLATFVGEVGAYFVGNPGFGSGANGRIAAERLYRLRPAGVGIFPWIGPFDTTAGGSTNDVSALQWAWTRTPPSPTP
jgi:mannan endo-1,4-beta-mannosidase